MRTDTDDPRSPMANPNRQEERVPAATTWRILGALVLLAVGPLCTAAAVRAQAPALAPTSDVSIVVNGLLHYSSIFVPAGVTVRFVLPLGSPPPFLPAVVICDSDAIVHGTLSVAGGVRYVPPFTSAAGSVTTGRGNDGLTCGSNLYIIPPAGGRHAGTYGSVLPFSLDGGSPGGDHVHYSDPICTQFAFRGGAGEGGGTLVLLAGGRIEIDGTVTADGGGGSGGGSGGSILLRGDAGVTVLPSGTITALGGGAATALPPWPPLMSIGASGYVRFDAWGVPPSIQGTVTPAPTVLELPYLRSQSQPRIGTTWICEVFAPEAVPIFVAASPTAGSGAPTPFGPLGIDLPTASILAYAAVTPSGHDPFVSVPTPVPNVPALVGAQAWIQALAFPPVLPARLSNTLAVAVQ